MYFTSQSDERNDNKLPQAMQEHTLCIMRQLKIRTVVCRPASNSAGFLKTLFPDWMLIVLKSSMSVRHRRHLEMLGLFGDAHGVVSPSMHSNFARKRGW